MAGWNFEQGQAGTDQGTPDWIMANVDSILATIERLYAVAIEDHLGSQEFFSRMAWLPVLLVQLEPGKPLDG